MKIQFLSNGTNVNWFQFRLRSPTGSEETPENGKTDLLGNYPNPFTDATVISYQVGRPSHIVPGVFNTLGQSVRTLADHHHPSGKHTTILYADGLSTGTNSYRLTGDEIAKRTLQYLGK
ncbi:MAG: hypothetical protein F4221_01640 [Rhodothermaceae bacterium]|nr:hypothetical protein [Rhodothermaceae bacterium]